MRTRLSIAVFTALASLLALPLAASAATTDVSSDDKNKVMAVTAVVALFALGLATLGYLYRRQRGMIVPPEDTSHTAEHH